MDNIQRENTSIENYDNGERHDDEERRYDTAVERSDPVLFWPEDDSHGSTLGSDLMAHAQKDWEVADVNSERRLPGQQKAVLQDQCVLGSDDAYTQGSWEVADVNSEKSISECQEENVLQDARNHKAVIEQIEQSDPALFWPEEGDLDSTAILTQTEDISIEESSMTSQTIALAFRSKTKWMIAIAVVAIGMLFLMDFEMQNTPGTKDHLAAQSKDRRGLGARTDFVVMEDFCVMPNRHSWDTECVGQFTNTTPGRCLDIILAESAIWDEVWTVDTVQLIQDQAYVYGLAATERALFSTHKYDNNVYVYDCQMSKVGKVPVPGMVDPAGWGSTAVTASPPEGPITLVLASSDPWRLYVIDIDLDSWRWCIRHTVELRFWPASVTADPVTQSVTVTEHSFPDPGGAIHTYNCLGEHISSITLGGEQATWPVCSVRLQPDHRDINSDWGSTSSFSKYSTWVTADLGNNKLLWVGEDSHIFQIYPSTTNHQQVYYPQSIATCDGDIIAAGWDTIHRLHSDGRYIRTVIPQGGVSAPRMAVFGCTLYAAHSPGTWNLGQFNISHTEVLIIDLQD